MPSAKDPVEAVQPGPGRLPNGTVTATSLTFPIGAGSSAALQAHITDPVGAHAASAISNAPVGGAGPRVSSATDVQSTLSDVYTSLNNEAVWVLDAASSAPADYSGSSALVTAMQQIALNGRRKILFLRPGVYTWDDSRVFTGVTIIGDAVGSVQIQNGTTGMRIGADATFKNVFISVNTDLVMQDSGHSLLQNVDLSVTGFFTVQSQYNAFLQCQRSSGGAPLYVNVTDGHNSFTQVNASQLSDSSGVGGNAYRDLVLDNAPKDSTTNVLSVSSSHATFTGVMMAPTGSFTAPIVSVTGTFNSFRDIKIGPITSTTGPVVLLSGDNNNLDFVRISNVAASTFGVNLGGNFNALTNIRLHLVVCQFSLLQLTGDSNRWDGLEALSDTCSQDIIIATSAAALNEIRNVSVTSSTTPQYVLDIAGPNNVFEKVAVTSVTGCTGVVLVSSSRNTLRDLNFSSVSALSSFLVLLGGNGHVVDGVTVSAGTLTQAGANAIKFDTSSNVRLSNVSIASTTGIAGSVLVDCTNTSTDGTIEHLRFINCSTGLSLLRVNAPRYTVSDVEVRNSFTGITSSLIDVGGVSVESSVNGIYFDSMTGVNIPLVKIDGTTCAARNIHVGTVTSTGNFSIVRVGGTEALVDGVVARNLATLPASNALFDYSLGPVGSVIQNVVIDTVGGTTAPSALINIATACSKNTLRNWNVTALRTGSDTIFGINTTVVDGLLIDNVNVSGTIVGYTLTAQSVQYYFNFSASNLTTITHGVTLQNCRVVSADTGFSHIVFGIPSFTQSPISTFRCHFEVTNFLGSGAPCISTINASRLSFRECTIVAPCTYSGSETGAAFTDCTFKSVVVAGVTGAQLFNGWGRVGTAQVPSEALVIRNCTMLTSTCNNVTASTSRPNVFLGGADTTANTNHGAVVVDGLKIGRNPSVSFSFWHRSPILTIDLASQSPRVESSFNNIVIDMENTPFTGDATGSDVFGDIAGSGTVVEIHGTQAAVVTGKTVVKGLSVLRISRNAGGGNRAVLKAVGVSIENLTIDAAVGAAGNWLLPIVELNNCTLRGADFYPTTSLPITDTGYGIHLYAENGSWCEGVRMRNFAINPAEQVALVFLADSSLVDSSFDMQNGSHLPTDGAVIVATGSAANECWIANNYVTFDHNASSAGDNRFALSCVADGAHIVNNVFKNLATAQAAGFSSTPASSNGGGCQVSLDSNRITFEGNFIEFQWANGTNNQPSISSNGDRCNIIGNFTKNTANTTFAGGGCNQLLVTGGLYTNVSNNVVEAANNIIFHVQIDTTGGAAGIIIGNRIDNGTGNNGELFTDASDLPEPGLNLGDPSIYNQLT